MIESPFHIFTEHLPLPSKVVFKTLFLHGHRHSSVVDPGLAPDPKLLAGFGSGYGFGKISPDPDPGSSSSEMNVKKNYSEKLKTDIIWQFLNKNALLKNINSFYKKFSKKLVIMCIMQPDTLTRRGYKEKIYVKHIRKVYVRHETGSGSETNRNVGSGFGYGSEENHFRSTTLLHALSFLCFPSLWHWELSNVPLEANFL